MLALFDKLSELIEHKDIDIYLVGGAVRDLFLKKKINDYDFVLREKVAETSREFADLVSGSLIKLDKKRGIYRVVKDGAVYDFNKIQGNNLKEDLANRDFTINALGLPFNQKVLSTIKKINSSNSKINGYNHNLSQINEMIIDPLSGKEDLESKLIKVVSPEAISKDPLRILRGIRFKAVFSFTIDNTTEKLLKDNVEKLDKVAEERIKDELLQIFSCEKIHEIIRYMEDKIGILSYLFPEINGLKDIGQCKYHNEDVWTHSLFLLQILEKLRLKNPFNKYLKEGDLPLLRWSGLFHDIGKLETESVEKGKTHFRGHAQTGARLLAHKMRNLKFSNQAVRFVKTLLNYHMRPLSLYCEKKVTPKAFYRFFDAVGELTPAVCLLSAADVYSTRQLNGKNREGEKYLKYIYDILEKYEKMGEKTITPLLDGEEVMEILGLSPGPIVGEILNKLKEAQALGKIESKNEAKKYIKNLEQLKSN